MHWAAKRALGDLPLRAAEHLEREATERTPVDTGRMRGSWLAFETGPTSAVVKNPVRYASFVEFDTRHWISGKVVPGQRFLGRAIAETEEILPEMAEAHLRGVLEEVFR